MSIGSVHHRLLRGPLVADVLGGRDTRWINTALRTRSDVIPDVLAQQLVPGASASLLTARVVDGDSAAFAATRANLPIVASLGTILAASATDDATLRAGHLLLREALRDDLGAFAPLHQQIFAQAAFLLGDIADVAWVLEQPHGIRSPVEQALRADLLHPRHAPDHRREWHEALSVPFRRVGLQPISVTEEQATLFDGLRAGDGEEVDGPLVTVIMPCFNPGVELLTSVRSIIDQTYSNLEILIVDDASDLDHRTLIESATQMDSRVRLVRQETNGGTYLARNAALAVARGEYVTVQDADDWSHPSRIARQVEALESDPAASASRSEAIRARDDLTHQWIGYGPRRPNASSLLFRLADVTRVGPFDAVRKSADSEFHERLETLVGPVVNIKEPLAITRLRSGTLSRGDFMYQWTHPDRRLYRAAYREWHESLRRRRGDSPSPTLVEGSRPFPVPISFLRGRAESEPDEIAGPAHLVVLDASDERAAAACLDLTTRVPMPAVLHLEDGTRGQHEPPEPAPVLLHAARRGKLDLIGSPSSTIFDTVIVLTPGTLEVPPAVPRGLSCGRLLALAPLPQSGRPIPDFLSVRDGARAMFGVAPTWCVADEETQDAWAQDGWDLPLLATLLPPPDTRDDSG